MILGNPSFLAPEIAQQQAPSAATDVYGIGQIVYWTATGGQVPFHGETPIAILYLKVMGTPKWRDGFPDEVRQVFARCFRADPGARWHSASAFFDALAACLRRG